MSGGRQKRHSSPLTGSSAQKDVLTMLKKFSFAFALVAVLSVRAMAGDEIDIASLDVDSISDADNVIVGASLDVDVDDLTNKSGDKNDVAVEACFRSCGGYGGYGGYGCGYNYGCYRSCYSPCYSYSYCYQPTYFCYRPVTYCAPCYTYTQTCQYQCNYNYGCHQNYGCNNYCNTYLNNWGCGGAY